MNRMEYIRKFYDVPAKRGGRVVFDGRGGTIVSARNAHLRIRPDDGGRILLCHPTWRMEYLKEESNGTS